MSIFGFRHRLQEGEGQGGGGGGDGQSVQGGAAEWLKPFGEHAKVFEGIKDPAELATKWTGINTELTNLKTNAPKFDWRKEIAGDDAEAAKLLGRFTDPKAFLKSFNEAQTKIRSGEITFKGLGKDATPEQVTEYRKANGIPLEPKGYFENLPDGLVIGKEDQPIFDRYAKLMHDANASPALMHAFAKQYYADTEADSVALADVNKKDATAATAALKKQWGSDYTANMSAISNMLEGAGKGMKDLFLAGTLANGKSIGNSPELMMLLGELALLKNPLAHVIPSAGEGDMKSLESEIANIKKLMADRQSDYWRGPKSAGLQQRYRDLVSAQGNLRKVS